MKKMIYDLNYEQLKEWLLEHNEKTFRTNQVFGWLYRKRIQEFSEMTDIKQSLIDTFNEEFVINPIKLKQRQASKDGTVKYLFELQDGFLVETVLMQFDYGKSVCVSSQVGCNMGCTFCASGLLKKNRDLTSGEMLAQVMFVQKELDSLEQRVSHIVIMGTGEPFDNYEHVMNFLYTVNHDLGLAIGARHLSVSTCGVVPRIRQFSREKVQYNLAISLHAPNDELRSKLMPINKAYPLAELMDALHEYSTMNNRRITFEYILLKGVNDQTEHANQLAHLVKGMNAYVNLIPYNVVDEHGFKAVDFAAAMKFYDKLMRLGVKSTLRKENGGDIDAACGQLRAKAEGKL